MASLEQDRRGSKTDTSSARTDNFILIAIAAIVVLLHLATNGRYGFHRDELQFLSDASHLDWGFVSYPPITPFLERIGLSVFGLSLVGLRLFSVLAQAIALVVTGMMARELGGGKLAQITAAVAVALSPLPLFEGTEFQYTSFDYLWWVLIAYFIIRLLKTVCALVACNWSRGWPWLGNQVLNHVFHRRHSRRYGADECATTLPVRLVLGRRRIGCAGVSAQLALADPPRLHLVPVPAAHSQT